MSASSLTPTATPILPDTAPIQREVHEEPMRVASDQRGHVWLTVTHSSDRLYRMSAAIAKELAGRGVRAVTGGKVDEELAAADIVVILGPASGWGTYVHGIAHGRQKIPIWCWKESISAYGMLNWVGDPEQVIQFVEKQMREKNRYLHPKDERWELKEVGYATMKAGQDMPLRLSDVLSQVLGVKAARGQVFPGKQTPSERLAKFDPERGTFAPDLSLDHYSIIVNVLDLMAIPGSGFEWIHYYVGSQPARLVAKWRKEVSAIGGMRETDHEELTKVRATLKKARDTVATGNTPDVSVVELEKEESDLLAALKAAEVSHRYAVDQLAAAEKGLLPYDRTKVPVKVEG